MAVKIIRNMGGVRAKVEKGKQSMVEAVTEAVISYGNVFVREDQGTLMESALIASRPKDGLAIWDTVYAKRVYEAVSYTHLISTKFGTGRTVRNISP